LAARRRHGAPRRILGVVVPADRCIGAHEVVLGVEPCAVGRGDLGQNDDRFLVFAGLERVAAVGGGLGGERRGEEHHAKCHPERRRPAPESRDLLLSGALHMAPPPGRGCLDSLTLARDDRCLLTLARDTCPLHDFLPSISRIVFAFLASCTNNTSSESSYASAAIAVFFCRS